MAAPARGPFPTTTSSTTAGTSGGLGTSAVGSTGVIGTTGFGGGIGSTGFPASGKFEGGAGTTAGGLNSKSPLPDDLPENKCACCPPAPPPPRIPGLAFPPSEYIEDYLAGYGHPNIVLVLGTSKDFKWVCRVGVMLKLPVLSELLLLRGTQWIVCKIYLLRLPALNLTCRCNPSPTARMPDARAIIACVAASSCTRR